MVRGRSRGLALAIVSGLVALACSLTQGADGYRTGARPDAATGACGPGTADCNGSSNDGCEVALATDTKNCGACRAACPELPHASAACVEGVCGMAPDSCTSGARDCNAAADDGCECAPPHGVASCGDADACGLERCQEGFADCNARPDDGCEVALDGDASHCGRCGHACGGGACVAGTCRPIALAPNQPSPGQIILDLDYVYWTNYGAGTTGGVVKVRNDGQNLAPIASGQTNAWGVAVEDTGLDVFWTTSAPGSGGTSIVGRAAKAGHAAAAPATVVSMTGRLRGVALDPTSPDVYFALYEGATPGVYRADRRVTAGAPVLVAAVAHPNSVIVDDAAVWFTGEGTGGASGVVAFVPKSATMPATPTVVASGLLRPRGLAVDASAVYWANAGSLTAGARDASVEKNLKSGGPANKTTLATGLADVRELAVDATHVYFTSYRDETVARVPKTATPGTAATILARNPEGADKVVVQPLAIATDATYVYWSNFGVSGGTGGAIMRLVKP